MADTAAWAARLTGTTPAMMAGGLWFARLEERRAEAATWLTLGDNGDGTYSGRFTIPELHGRLLRNRLELLSTPPVGQEPGRAAGGR